MTDSFSSMPPGLYDELARLLNTPDGLRLARLLQYTQMLHPSPEQPIDSTVGRDATHEPIPIGIWEPRQVDGALVFVRPEPSPWGDDWSIRPCIPAAKGSVRRRICFLGESTAAGFFYAPHLTPAQILQEQLDMLAGPETCEVVDLSKTGLRTEELVPLARAALQLAPDLLVIFAGNNAPEALQRDRLAASRHVADAIILQESGVRGLMRSIEQRRYAAWEEALAALAALSRQAEVRVVLVVPEVNLADWERQRPVAWLPGDQTQQWHELREQALQALRQGSYPTAASTAYRMLELDQGTCPTSFRILATALQAQGATDTLYDIGLQEVDSSQWEEALPPVPGATSGVRETLRTAARRYGFACVDLPTIFREHTAAPLPGQELFLDYCHLTVTGMTVAMAGVSAALLQLAGMAGGKVVDWRAILQAYPEPHCSPRVDSLAKLQASIHHAHWNLPILGENTSFSHWCIAALQTSPELGQVLLDLIEAKLAPGLELLSAAKRRNFESRDRLHWTSHQFPNLDGALIEGLLEILDRYGESATEKVTSAIEAHLGYHGHRLEIHRYPYRSVPATNFDDTEPLYRAAWPRSTFYLVAHGASDLLLDLTLRIPVIQEPRSGEVVLLVNQQPCARIMVDQQWRRQQIRVQQHTIKQGINSVTLCWPKLPAEGDQALLKQITRLQQGLPAGIHPVFGELFALIVTQDNGV